MILKNNLLNASTTSNLPPKSLFMLIVRAKLLPHVCTNKKKHTHHYKIDTLLTLLRIENLDVRLNNALKSYHIIKRI